MEGVTQSHRLRIAFMINAAASARLPNRLRYADVAVLNTHLSDGCGNNVANRHTKKTVGQINTFISGRFE